VEALEHALARFRIRGDREQAADALIVLSRVASKLGERRGLTLAAEAVELLERGEPGQALVDAYTNLAGTHLGAYAEAIAAAERALSLAEQLALPPPPRALGARGFARAGLGEREGIAEAEQALTLLVEQGAGHHAAALMNNLALARLPLEGPATSLAACEQAIPFCEQRGLAETVACSRRTGSSCWPPLVAARRRSPSPTDSPPMPNSAATQTR
jgi:hypothetical protein